MRHAIESTASPLLLLLTAFGQGGCSEAPTPDAAEGTGPLSRPPAEHPLRSTLEEASPSGVFLDVTEASGLAFQHFNGATGELLLPEITGAGGALFDYDGDGDLDLYLVQGAPLTPGREDWLVPWTGPWPPRDRLFRNDLPEPGALPVFTDVTSECGIVATGYGMGVATGDVDNDGRVDLFVTNLGPDQLFRNLGDGRFEDVSAAANLGDPRWSTSATFLDFDGDGYLDLFVTSYVDFDVNEKRLCYSQSSALDYCGPDTYEPLADRLYRNRGDGTFEDVSAARGILEAFGAGLGVVSGDFDGDGRVDLYVANDGDPNQLWLQREERFVDDALLAGVGLNHLGRAEASMGVDAGDLDGDGNLELFMTHLEGESNTLYWNLGSGLFEDRTIRSGLHAASLPFTSFGTGFLDFDGDGQLDLLALNGAVRRIEALARAGDPFPLRQPNQLFRNLGEGVFEVVAGALAPTFAEEGVSRGAVLGDVDDDGVLDVVVCNNGAAARLLLGRAPRDEARSHWLGLRLIDPDTGRDATGARVCVETSGGRRLWRRVRSDGGYCSARDPRVLVRLGSESARVVRIHWPDGSLEVRDDLREGEYQTWTRGEGRAHR